MKDEEIKRYHSRKLHLNFDDAETLWATIAQAKYAFVSMVMPDGEPYCVPLSLGYNRAENCLYFHTGFDGKKLDAIRHNPRVCAVIMRDDGYAHGQCHHHFQSVICYGSMRELADETEKRAALQAMFRGLEGDTAAGDAALRLRRVDSISMDRVNILRMDIDAISGKRSTVR